MKPIPLVFKSDCRVDSSFPTGSKNSSSYVMTLSVDTSATGICTDPVQSSLLAPLEAHPAVLAHVPHLDSNYRRNQASYASVTSGNRFQNSRCLLPPSILPNLHSPDKLKPQPLCRNRHTETGRDTPGCDSEDPFCCNGAYCLTGGGMASPRQHRKSCSCSHCHGCLAAWEWWCMKIDHPQNFIETPAIARTPIAETRFTTVTACVALGLYRGARVDARHRTELRGTAPQRNEPHAARKNFEAN